MTILPKTFRRFAKEAEGILKNGGVREVIFSGKTYQVLVLDPLTDTGSWVFFQFGEKSQLNDYFCSCDEEGENTACVHLAAAYLRLFQNNATPLHVRFKHSIWNRLCLFFFREYGCNPSHLQDAGNSWTLVSSKGEKVFTCIYLSDQLKQELKLIFSDRKAETEENSLKFSNLSETEIHLWKQGRPTFGLQYELSYWSDLAKWLMLRQDVGLEYAFEYDYNLQGIPCGIRVTFEDAFFYFFITKSCLNQIIKALATIKSELEVFGQPEKAIEEITYDAMRNQLHVLPKTNIELQRSLQERKNIIIGDWIYFPKIGFWPRDPHPLLRSKVFSGREIGKVLEAYNPIIKLHLTNSKINDTPHLVSYRLSFDEHWNLCISMHVCHPGDLQLKTSQFFGEWAYIEAKGFIALEAVVFDSVETVIKEPDVVGFIHMRRSWLNEQEGFGTHIAGIQTKVTYSMSEEGHLSFHRFAVVEDEAVESKDFGPWVYIRGQGFYAKDAANLGTAIRSGTVIKREQIPFFIRMYQEELFLIQGFFSEECPVKKLGLHIELTPMNTILITQEPQLKPEYKGRRVRLFEEYAYMEGKGFSKIPQAAQLPGKYRYTLKLEKENLLSFFEHERDQLKDDTLWIDPRLLHAEKLKLIADPLRRHPKGYSVQLIYESSKGAIPFAAVWRAWKKRDRFFISSLGLIDLHEDRFYWIQKISAQQIDQNTNVLTMTTLDLLRLCAFEPLHVKRGKELLDELIEFQSPYPPPLQKCKSRFRPYQAKGVEWMWFLYCHLLSGFLCDEMGLGKTHQAMGLLAAVADIQKERCHFLVVCPTSVIYHWEEKLQIYLPHLKVCTFHGAKRSLNAFHEDYDILLTSYGIWRNESLLLCQVQFEIAIFDEIQAAKNQASRLHTSLLNVKARVKIGMTGTPIENSLIELKALFDIILPHYFPNKTEYRKYFIKPIERKQNKERKKLLSRIVKPFVLRRMKVDVLTDLPEKTEEIIHCELSLDQKLLYNDILEKVRKGIFYELADPSATVPYIHIFSALTKLKQICNHPATFFKNPEEYERYASGKWDLFVELLGEALGSGQKVVVFSQYLAMLDIFEKYLTKNRIQYASIRGATAKRREQIRKFNDNPRCEVFVGSLHAAGLGIDLTAGSVVIHYDRWWNSARENQATDRVHRIGQVRGVQVFKFVTKGTFEERIDEIITRKGKLMEDIVGSDDYRVIKQFEREELMQLFREVQEEQ